MAPNSIHLYKRNEPAQFPVTGVITGWTEALQLMPVGSKFKLYIPQILHMEQMEQAKLSSLIQLLSLKLSFLKSFK